MTLTLLVLWWQVDPADLTADSLGGVHFPLDHHALVSYTPTEQDKVVSIKKLLTGFIILLPQCLSLHTLRLLSCTAAGSQGKSFFVPA